VFLLVCWQWQPGWALVQFRQQQVKVLDAV
jgi:hypothetical protein